MKKQHRILLVDDDDGILLLLKAYLEARGYSIDVSLSGKVGLDQVRSTRYDLILLDILLPNEDGFHVLKSMRKIKSNKYIPIIMLTASDRKEHRAACYECGADDFISKPLDFIELEIRIKSLLRIKTQNDRLEHKHRQLKKANMDIFFMLAKACEARDQDTGTHIRRIQNICTSIAKEIKIPEKHIEEIGLACMMHDVGKVKIPDFILLKPCKLSTDEWEIMKKHTVYGCSLLGNNHVFQMAQEVAKYHHEWWDGNGYPSRKREEEIPLAARICMVADVYDALTHKRVYKEAWPEEKAYHDMLPLFGTQFDPNLKGVFHQLYQDGTLHTIAKQFPE